MKETMIETFSPEETHALGKKIGQQAKPGDVYTLIGDLGVGKTVFTQGIAEGLGIREPICSPTFTIVQVYEEGRMPFYHFDVYRIGDIEEMDEIGYEDYFYGNGLCMIEWANLIEEILPEKRHDISIEKDLEKGFDYRKIIIRIGLKFHRCHRSFRWTGFFYRTSYRFCNSKGTRTGAWETVDPHPYSGCSCIQSRR